VRAQWMHLLPGYDETMEGVPRGQRWRPGHELRPREVQILSLLRDHGSLSRSQIARYCGGLWVAREGWLSGLLARDLVETIPAPVGSGRGCGRLYRLAAAALPPCRPRRDTGHERDAKRAAKERQKEHATRKRLIEATPSAN